MPCCRVEVAPDAYFMCLSHALITDQEEVMGLLVGETEEVPGTSDSVARVAGVHILTRSDKKPDRCEISPMQLAGASAEAERLAGITGRPIRIIGWYHSHPHITVLPSHVDVRTQGAWQMMDDTFVGLIFSVFNEEASKTQRIQTIAFQSVLVPEASCETFTQRDVPISLVPHGWPQTLLGVRSPETLSSLARVLFEEEIEMVTQASEQASSVLQQMHHQSIHNKFLSKFVEYTIQPFRQYFTNTQCSCQQQLEAIALQKESKLIELDMLKAQVAERQAARARVFEEQAQREAAAAQAEQVAEEPAAAEVNGEDAALAEQEDSPFLPEEEAAAPEEAVSAAALEEIFNAATVTSEPAPEAAAPAPEPVPAQAAQPVPAQAPEPAPAAPFEPDPSGPA
eukprot:TRINITY_DN21372_c0_g1_i1.p1 TRINITY_DN21372_c0_g1~~TRINITY_DN21372_c0_g1_i1.p1  ORF type:complete len:397 (+),score=115.13 TRINITY_DN21372_c0_g1_i1:167-1357(+)